MRATQLFTLIFVVTLTSVGSVFAQATVGAYTAEQQSILESTDNTFTDGRYYKNLSISMAKGEGAMFYMRAIAFEPMIYTLDNSQVNWANGTNILGEDSAYTSVLTIIADKDTTFNVIYSSTVSGATGDFVYGMRKLSEQQMVVPDPEDFCGRLIYTINNWQCMWYLMPGTESFGGKSFDNSISLGGDAWLDAYFVASEDLFWSEVSTEAETYYLTKIEEIKKCLDMTYWETEDDYFISDYDGVEYITTYFNVKGGTGRETFMQSFAILLELDVLGDSYVSIEFY
ncbi:MAG: hypothetical protein WBP43_11700 [Chitinophagales bacterium]|nr:hypothetical protein [Bacteroidota bacterium]